MATRSRFINRLVSMALCICMVLSLLTGISLAANAAEDISCKIDTGELVTLKDADGDGFYEISTADELYAFSAAAYDSTRIVDAEVICDITVNKNVLAKDGKPNDGKFREWTPTGMWNPFYRGTFDGGGHTISGLYCDDGLYVGFFSGVGDGGVVKNVTIADSYFRGSDYVGVVVAENVFGSTIENCHVRASVNGYNYIGGVAGKSKGTITNCSYSGTITGANNVGGIVGSNVTEVFHCYSTGTVSGESSVGGVVGYNITETTNCYSTGTVSGTNFVGSVAGKNIGNLINCYYLTGSAKDGKNVAQFGAGNGTQGSTTADIPLQTTPVSAEQLISGELAYLLQSSVAAVDGVIPQIWGQDLDNGKSVQSIPTFTGAKVYYGYLSCADSEKIYTNTPASAGKIRHTGEGTLFPDDNGTTHTGTYSCCGVLVTEEHTFQSEDHKCICGKAESCAITLQYPTLLLEDEIKLNVYFAINQDIPLENMGLIIWKEAPSVVDISTADTVCPGATYTPANNQYRVNTDGIPAQNLSRSVYFCIYAELEDGSFVYSKQVSYSPSTYAYNQLKSSSTTLEAKSLFVAILNYGAAAQTYLNDTAPLVNANLTEDMKALIEDYNEDMVHSVTMPSVSKQGALVANGGFCSKKPTIALDSSFSVNYYFTPTYNVIGKMTFFYWNAKDFVTADVLSIDNATGSAVMTNEDGVYSAAISGIAAKDVDGALYACGVYTDVNGNTYSTGILPYSLGYYCSNQANGTGALSDLAAAIAVYGYYASIYFTL